jgi:hypothetical protein
VQTPGKALQLVSGEEHSCLATALGLWLLVFSVVLRRERGHCDITSPFRISQVRLLRYHIRDGIRISTLTDRHKQYDLKIREDIT